jgi:hypothetical protein
MFEYLKKISIIKRHKIGKYLYFIKNFPCSVKQHCNTSMGKGPEQIIHKI